MSKIAYRICERKGKELFTLFHGINGSRRMPINEWLSAKIRPVRDGSRQHAKLYQSGFHVFLDSEECERFINRFSKPRDLVMVKCEIGRTWEKEHSPTNVLLTDRIRLIKVIKKLK